MYQSHSSNRENFDPLVGFVVSSNDGNDGFPVNSLGFANFEARCVDEFKKVENVDFSQPQFPKNVKPQQSLPVAPTDSSNSRDNGKFPGFPSDFSMSNSQTDETSNVSPISFEDLADDIRPRVPVSYAVSEVENRIVQNKFRTDHETFSTLHNSKGSLQSRRSKCSGHDSYSFSDVESCSADGSKRADAFWEDSFSDFSKDDEAFLRGDKSNHGAPPGPAPVASELPRRSQNTTPVRRNITRIKVLNTAGELKIDPEMARKLIKEHLLASNKEKAAEAGDTTGSKVERKNSKTKSTDKGERPKLRSKSVDSRNNNTDGTKVTTEKPTLKSVSKVIEEDKAKDQQENKINQKSKSGSKSVEGDKTRRSKSKEPKSVDADKTSKSKSKEPKSVDADKTSRSKSKESVGEAKSKEQQDGTSGTRGRDRRTRSKSRSAEENTGQSKSKVPVEEGKSKSKPEGSSEIRGRDRHARSKSRSDENKTSRSISKEPKSSATRPSRSKSRSKSTEEEKANNTESKETPLKSVEKGEDSKKSSKSKSSKRPDSSDAVSISSKDNSIKSSTADKVRSRSKSKDGRKSSSEESATKSKGHGSRSSSRPPKS